MSADPLLLTAEVDRATQRLLSTAEGLDDAAIAGPSLLPGWSRGHVLTHLARNADGLTNLLNWARTGVVTPQYASEEKRNADIEAGAPRGAAEQAADLRGAHARFATATQQLSPETWTVVLETPHPQTPTWVMWRRLREVEVHHVDLDAGYRAADWPVGFAHRLLDEIVGHLSGRSDAPPMRLHATDTGHELSIGAPDGAPTITGPAYAVAAWLTGRTAGADLTVSPTGSLPSPPEWI